MSRQLIAHSRDLQRLVEDGFAVQIVGAYLVVRDVPYVNASREIAYGSLVTDLVIAGSSTARPDRHFLYFTGSKPYRSDGSDLDSFGVGEVEVTVSPDIVARVQLSAYPRLPDGQQDLYADYHHKIATYVGLLESEAQRINPDVTARKFAPVVVDDDEGPFLYLDSATARSGTGVANQKLACERVAIVGLGGTGSYVLDLLAKTPVGEIHLFDHDVFLAHNAFRAPGAASLGELDETPTKVEYLAAIYRKMRSGIVPHVLRLGEGNAAELDAFDFVFLCLDDSVSKAVIVDHLELTGVSFVDVGMGLFLTKDTVGGTLRVSVSTPNDRKTLRSGASLGDAMDDLYASNIQLADLNALNAALAVVRWKKHRGFYFNHDHHRQQFYMVDTDSYSD